MVYFADFHIHLAAVGPSRTSVTVFTYDSSVVAGLEWRPAHGQAYIFVEVPPSSIEECEIPLRIGRQLDATDMPALKVPGPDAPVKKLTPPRQR